MVNYSPTLHTHRIVGTALAGRHSTITFLYRHAGAASALPAHPLTCSPVHPFTRSPVHLRIVGTALAGRRSTITFFDRVYRHVGAASALRLCLVSRVSSRSSLGIQLAHTRPIVVIAALKQLCRGLCANQHATCQHQGWLPTACELGCHQAFERIHQCGISDS